MSAALMGARPGCHRQVAFAGLEKPARQHPWASQTRLMFLMDGTDDDDDDDDDDHQNGDIKTTEPSKIRPRSPPRDEPTPPAGREAATPRLDSPVLESRNPYWQPTDRGDHCINQGMGGGKESRKGLPHLQGHSHSHTHPWTYSPSLSCTTHHHSPAHFATPFLTPTHPHPHNCPHTTSIHAY